MNEYVWVMPLVAIPLLSFLYWQVIKKRIGMNEAQKQICRSIVIRVVSWTAMPFAAIGAGVVFGGIVDLLDYLYPRDGNSWVLVFHFVLVFVWIDGLRWMFLAGGAEAVMRNADVLGVMAPTGIHDPQAFRKMSGWLCLGLVAAYVALIWLGWLPDLRRSHAG